MKRKRNERAVADYVAAIEACDPAVVTSTKRQLNAMAAGDATLELSREDYETSVGSAEVRRWLAGVGAETKALTCAIIDACSRVRRLRGAI